ncbi:amino acid/auxin permease, AAAP family, partial [Galdieria sulphuraria]
MDCKQNSLEFVDEGIYNCQPQEEQAQSSKVQLPEANNAQAELDPDKLPESLKSNWVLVVILLVAETESASQLSLPSVVMSMGFVPGAIFLVFFGIMAMYTGFLISDIWKSHPLVRNYDEVVGIHFGRIAKEVALWCQVTLLFCFVAANIMVSAQAFYIAANQKTCYIVFSVVVTLIGILISVPRTLKGVAYLSISCIIFVAVPEIMTLTAVAVQNSPEPDLSIGASSGASAFAITNLVDFFVAISDIVFAYSGHLLFFNLIIEMGNPYDFKKAVFWGFTINIINYLIIGLGIYAYTGNYSQSPYILNIISSSV